jgi:putative tryptophan/tyrosine transport system substrate-binding protein
MHFGQVKRREFISLLGGAAAWPHAARAQQPAMPVIGWLSPGSQEADRFRLTAFERGLAETGHVVGRNVAMEYRWAEDRNDRLPALVVDLVQRRVNVIAAAGVAAVHEAKAATSTVPIVFVSGADPVTLGLVASLSRPGANVTGVTDLTVDLGPKQLEILHELAPSARRIALLVNPNNASAETLLGEITVASRTLGLEIHVLRASGERDLAAAFRTLPELRVEGVVMGTDALFNSQSQQLAKLAADHSLPSIHALRQFVAAGGLASYGGGLATPFRRNAGRAVHGVLRRDQTSSPTERASAPPP